MIAIQSPDRQLITVRGVVEGCIAYQVQGDHGFGYDPIFIPTGYDRTFSVLGPDIKHQMSHRSRALKQAANVLQPMLSVT